MLLYGKLPDEASMLRNDAALASQARFINSSEIFRRLEAG
jgi:hypothetical protein